MTVQQKNERLLGKIEQGLELSYQRLLETKRRNNEYLVVMHDDKIVSIKP